MKERPILFSGEMVCAILDGRKTQTRRVVKQEIFHAPPGKSEADFNLSARLKFLAMTACPYGYPGDRLWVRETWAPVSPDAERRPIRDCKIEYRADHPSATRAGEWDNAPDDAEAIRWRPSIHLPRWASRLTLEITDVRVERLQDISEGDAQAEGRTLEDFGAGGPGYFPHTWDDINAKRGFSWGSNPWVWALTFRRVET